RLEPVPARRGGVDPVAAGRQRGGDHLGHSRLVLDDEHAQPAEGGHAGSRTVNRAPPPGAPSTAIEPPWASTMALQMASPIPLVPATGPDRNGAKMAAPSPGGMPSPQSVTVTATPRCGADTDSMTADPTGVWRAAFSNRLVSTCSSWT